MNFVLCGMMGCGKTKLGKLIASSTGREWADTDELLVSRYGSIVKLFSSYGEEYFRQKEEEIIEELSKKDGLVISTGGGSVLRRKNVENLKKQGTILFLRAKKQTLTERLSKDTARPLLQGEENLEAKIEGLLKERTPVYESVADLILDVDGYSAMQNAERAILLLKGAGTR